MSQPIDPRAILSGESAATWQPVRDRHGTLWCEYDPATNRVRLVRTSGGRSGLRRVAVIDLDALADGEFCVTTHTE